MTTGGLPLLCPPPWGSLGHGKGRYAQGIRVSNNNGAWGPELP